MALIVEDGSGVTNADSYVSRADYIAFALTLGVTIADADAADVELRTAAQYIDQHEPNMKGTRVTRDQYMAFPRYNVVIDDWSWLHTELPRQLTTAQMLFALDVHAGVDLWNQPVNPALAKKSSRVEGAVTVAYAVKDGVQKVGRTSKAEAHLAQLLRNNGVASISLVRR